MWTRQSKYSLKTQFKNTLRGEETTNWTNQEMQQLYNGVLRSLMFLGSSKQQSSSAGQHSAAFCPTCIIRRPLTFACLCLQAQMGFLGWKIFLHLQIASRTFFFRLSREPSPCCPLPHPEICSTCYLHSYIWTQWRFDRCNAMRQKSSW